MTMPALPLDGGCRCGKVRFRISAPPLITAVCHCLGCQRMTAGAFSTTVMVPADGFAVTAGEPVIGGLHGEQSHHHHCDWCKSWLFTTFAMPFVNVRATMLDDVSWFAPYIESYTSEALPWAKTGAARSFPQFPSREEYGPLMAEYAERGARPSA